MGVLDKKIRKICGGERKVDQYGSNLLVVIRVYH